MKVLGRTSREETWGEQFTSTLAAHGVDKPANIAGASFESCNNPSAALGHRPSIHTSAPHDDAWLWIKHPGVCNIGGLPAGTRDGNYALSLMNNAVKAGSLSIIQPTT